MGEPRSRSPICPSTPLSTQRRRIGRLIALRELLTLVASDAGNTLGDVGSGLTISSPEAEDTVDKVLSKYRIDLSHQPKVPKALLQDPGARSPRPKTRRSVSSSITARRSPAAQPKHVHWLRGGRRDRKFGGIFARDLGPMLAQASAELWRALQGFFGPPQSPSCLVANPRYGLQGVDEGDVIRSLLWQR